MGVQRNVETKRIKKIISDLYDAVHNSGWSSHLYRDEDWHNLYAIREICNAVLPEGYKCLCQEVYGYSHANNCKDYLFTIEHEHTGERIIDVDVRAMCAGSMNNPWDAYDCIAQFYKHENI